MFCEASGSSAANCSVAVLGQPLGRCGSLSMQWRSSIASRAQPSGCQPSGSSRASQLFVSCWNRGKSGTLRKKPSLESACGA